MADQDAAGREARVEEPATGEWLGDVKVEWRKGWRVVLAAAVGLGSTSALLAMASNLFIVPMATELDVSRTAVAVGPIKQFMLPVASAIVGGVVMVWGARRTAFTGIAVLVLAYLGMALLPFNLATLYLLAPVFAAGAAMTNAIAYSKGVGSWFTSGLGGALALMLTGVTVISAVAIPVLTYVIADHGWRVGYYVLAGSALASLPLLYFCFHDRDWKGPAKGERRPAQFKQSVRLIRDALRDRNFVFLLAAVLLSAIPVGGFLSNLAPILIDLGHDRGVIAAVGSSYVIAIGVGRILIGFMLDRFKPSRVAASCFSLAAAGAFLLFWSSGHGDSFGIMLLSLVLIGLAQGAEADILPFYCIRLFGRATYVQLLGVLLGCYSLAMACGGMMFAISRDLTGDYMPAVAIAGGMLAISALVILQVRLKGAGKTLAA